MSVESLFMYHGYLCGSSTVPGFSPESYLEHYNGDYFPEQTFLVFHLGLGHLTHMTCSESNYYIFQRSCICSCSDTDWMVIISMPGPGNQTIQLEWSGKVSLRIKRMKCCAQWLTSRKDSGGDCHYPFLYPTFAFC